MQLEVNSPSAETGEVLDGVGVVGGLDIGGDLLVDGRVDSVVHQVDVEGRGVGAIQIKPWSVTDDTGITSHVQTWLSINRNSLDGRPLDSDGVGGLELIVLSRLGHLQG